MVAFSTLRTQLGYLTGKDVLSTLESNILDECLNLSIAIEYGNDLPGLVEQYSGKTFPTLSTTVTAHTAATANVTLNSVAGVYPGDFFTVDTTGAQYTARSVNSSTAVVNVGIPIAGSLNGLAVTVTRRSLELPHAGSIIEIRQEDGPMPLRHEPLVSVAQQFETGPTVRFYRQGFAENRAVSYVNFYPAPNASKQMFFIQARAQSDDADLDIPMGLQKVILTTAAMIRRAYANNGGQLLGAAEMRNMTKHLRHETAAASGVQFK